jgi:ATP-binding cassette subfamily F protein 3
LERKQKELKRQQLDYDLQKEDINRLKNLAKSKQEDAAKGAKYVAPDNDHMLQGYRRNKSSDSLRDAKVIYNRIKRMDKVDEPQHRKSFIIDIDESEIGDSRDISIKDLVTGYDDFEIGPINLEISSSQRICILGLNGSGKTTLIKTLLGNLKQKKGEVEIGDGIKFGNLLQEQENLPINQTAVKFLIEKTGEEKGIVENNLEFFGFDKEIFNKEINLLSSGEKARLTMTLFALENANTLVLDEPTNHLDLEAIESLRKVVDKFKGTIIFVTHDREFVEQSRFDKLFLLENSQISEIPNFKEYLLEMEKKSKKLIRMIK